MHESTTGLKEASRHHLVVIALVALAAVEAFSLAALLQTPSQSGLNASGIRETGALVSRPPIKISEIQGSRIDDEAAMIVLGEREETPTALSSGAITSSLPVGIWVFLLAAYVALLIFNFSYTFRQAKEPQWFWETFYTFLALIAWYVLDESRTARWFPSAIVEFGLLTFALYAYLLEKKFPAEEEKTASLF